ncbi:hypothetical protein FACS1894180_7030 [Bacteroidia bacterium]|nr:hypothetical protein FACS1894180_7030 [Bacteroidia bacterium]
MEILSIKNSKVLAGLLYLIIVTGCSHHNGMKKHLEYLKMSGFVFYEKLDTFSLKGINRIDTLNTAKYPFYAIKDDSSCVKIQYFVSSTNISYTTYTRVAEYYISTKIFAEETANDFYKEVTVIHPNKIIIYEYSIYNNFEQLLRIVFLYQNGNKKIFENTTNSYYNICDTINENSIYSLFPTLISK